MPEQASVVGADDEIVATGVQVERGDPARAGLDDLEQLLPGEVIAADCALGRNEEDWFRGVEMGGLREAFEFAEG